MITVASTALPAKVRELQEGGWELDAIEDPTGSTNQRRLFISCRLPPSPPTNVRIEKP